jgi:hypothetical protein
VAGRAFDHFALVPRATEALDAFFALSFGKEQAHATAIWIGQHRKSGRRRG